MQGFIFNSFIVLLRFLKKNEVKNFRIVNSLRFGLIQSVQISFIRITCPATDGSEKNLERIKISLTWLVNNRNRVKVFYLADYESKDDLLRQMARG